MLVSAIFGVFLIRTKYLNTILLALSLAHMILLDYYLYFNLSDMKSEDRLMLHAFETHQSFYQFLSRLKSLTSECSVIIAALQKSKTGLLEISEDEKKVRRAPSKPLPEINDEYKDVLKHKSVYIVSCNLHILRYLNVEPNFYIADRLNGN